MRLSVIGNPATQGSKRGIPYTGRDGKRHVAIVESNPEKHREWKALVIDAAQQVFKRPGQASTSDFHEMIVEGPVVVSFTFYLPKPKSCPKWRIFPDKKPDSLKLARLVEDALTLIAYRDDAQIVDHHISKRFAVDRPPGVEIEIQPAAEGHP